MNLYLDITFMSYDFISVHNIVSKFGHDHPLLWPSDEKAMMRFNHGA